MVLAVHGPFLEGGDERQGVRRAARDEAGEELAVVFPPPAVLAG